MKHAREDYNRIQDPANLIPDDEPVFLLRGQDLAAPHAIAAWVEKAHSLGASKEITDAAIDQIAKMKVWQTNLPNGGKVPDVL